MYVSVSCDGRSIEIESTWCRVSSRGVSGVVELGGSGRLSVGIRGGGKSWKNRVGIVGDVRRKFIGEGLGEIGGEVVMKVEEFC